MNCSECDERITRPTYGEIQSNKCYNCLNKDKPDVPS